MTTATEQPRKSLEEKSWFQDLMSTNVSDLFGSDEPLPAQTNPQTLTSDKALDSYHPASASSPEADTLDLDTVDQATPDYGSCEYKVKNGKIVAILDWPSSHALAPSGVTLLRPDGMTVFEGSVDVAAKKFFSLTPNELAQAYGGGELGQQAALQSLDILLNLDQNGTVQKALDHNPSLKQSFATYLSAQSPIVYENENICENDEPAVPHDFGQSEMQANDGQVFAILDWPTQDALAPSDVTFLNSNGTPVFEGSTDVAIKEFFSLTPDELVNLYGGGETGRKLAMRSLEVLLDADANGTVQSTLENNPDLKKSFLSYLDSREFIPAKNTAVAQVTTSSNPALAPVDHSFVSAATYANSANAKESDTCRKNKFASFVMDFLEDKLNVHRGPIYNYLATLVASECQSDPDEQGHAVARNP